MDFGSIEIYVSNRSDIISIPIENNIYIPIICGAHINNDNRICKDDSGDNISSFKDYFSEFTVQYWMWKNSKAKYVGLCHYRRFLLIRERKIAIRDAAGFEHFPTCDKYFAENVGIDQAENWEQLLNEYDVVINKAQYVSRIPTPEGYMRNVQEHWLAHSCDFITDRLFIRMLEIVDEKYTELAPYIREYLSGKWFRGFNCYVMRKDIFDTMCEFQFDILFSLYKERKKLCDNKRNLAYIGEILYGAYTFYLIRKGFRVKELPLSFIEDTTISSMNLSNYKIRKIRTDMAVMKKNIVDTIFPYTSKRRLFVKKLLGA